MRRLRKARPLAVLDQAPRNINGMKKNCLVGGHEREREPSEKPKRERVKKELQRAGRLTSLMSSACSMTSVRPLSCREESREGSWNTNTVTTSVAADQDMTRQGGEERRHVEKSIGPTGERQTSTKLKMLVVVGLLMIISGRFIVDIIMPLQFFFFPLAISSLPENY